MADNVEFSVGNLIIGWQYTALLQVWRSAGAPTVAIGVRDIVGDETDVDEESTAIRVVFTALSTVENVLLIPTSSNYAGMEPVWVQGFLVTLGDSDIEYFDGNTPGAEWLGAINASVSQMRPQSAVPSAMVQLSYTSAWIE